MRHLLWLALFIIASVAWGWTGFFIVLAVWLVLFIIGLLFAALGLSAAAFVMAGRNRRY